MTGTESNSALRRLTRAAIVAFLPVFMACSSGSSPEGEEHGAAPATQCPVVQVPQLPASRVISAPDNASFPAIRTDDCGNALAVWQERDPGASSTRIRSAHYTSGAGWSVASTIGTYPDAAAIFADTDSHFAFVADSASGSALVVWVDHPRAERSRIMLARYERSVGWLPALAIEPETAPKHRPALTLRTDGGATVAWVESDPNQSCGAVLEVRDVGATLLAPEVRAWSIPRPYLSSDVRAVGLPGGDTRVYWLATDCEPAVSDAVDPILPVFRALNIPTGEAAGAAIREDIIDRLRPIPDETSGGARTGPVTAQLIDVGADRNGNAGILVKQEQARNSNAAVPFDFLLYYHPANGGRASRNQVRPARPTAFIFLPTQAALHVSRSGRSLLAWTSKAVSRPGASPGASGATLVESVGLNGGQWEPAVPLLYSGREEPFELMVAINDSGEAAMIQYNRSRTAAADAAVLYRMSQPMIWRSRADLRLLPAACCGVPAAIAVDPVGRLHSLSIVPAVSGQGVEIVAAIEP